MREVVRIEISIDRIEGKFKLSQNHPGANRAGVVRGLGERAGRRDGELADLMQQAEERRNER